MNKDQRRVLLQIALFIITFVTTTLAGTEWTIGKSIYGGGFTWDDFFVGMHFSIPFLLILSVHEFGHYFTARYYKVGVTLPYYIPLPPFALSIGTMGALIRLKTRSQSNIQNFDIGIAGPLAGFIMSLFVLYYGFTHLPPPEYIFQIHPEYAQYGLDYADHVYHPEEGRIDVVMGSTLLMDFFKHFVADPARVPNPHEMMHYPFLLAGFLSLLFTSLNLLPVGQLDGGHVLYGLLGGRRHRSVATGIFVGFMFYAGLGNSYIDPFLPRSELLIDIPLYVLFLWAAFSRLGLSRTGTIALAVVVFALQFLSAFFFPAVRGYEGWLLFGFILGRFIGIAHPPALIELPLDRNRKILGWLALFIFVICFSIHPIDIA